ncbi:MAG: YkgJ family cysteine cluster protein [Campylobacteraceae bacterium]|nr:YkgJ family cysteine cluster protein [Campylobacteraceae bacterium]
MITKEGFNYAFNADACMTCKGKCCTGKSGYIWVQKSEILALSEFLKIKDEDFILQYLSKIGFRYTLKEIPFQDGFACVLFDAENHGCKAYDARPSQCRSFPFWDYFKHKQKELEDECTGILAL